jgi:hypothetical protein
VNLQDYSFSLLKSDRIPIEVPTNDQEWSLIARQLHENGLEGYAFSINQKKIPPELFPKLESAWKKQWISNQIYMKELDLISMTFENKPIVLKGAALLRDIYPDFGSRFMSDVDLLVRPDQLQTAIRNLESIGYTPANTSKWWANDFKTVMVKSSQNLTIELHTKLFSSEPEGFEWQTSTSPAGPFLVLNHEDMLVHLIGHLAHQHNFLRLSWLLDIDLYIRKYLTQIDWLRVKDRCQTIRHKNSFGAVLWGLNQYFQTPGSVNVLPKCSPLITHSMTSEFVWTAPRQRIRYYLLKHALKDSFWEAALYDFGWIKNRLWSKSHGS